MGHRYDESKSLWKWVVLCGAFFINMMVYGVFFGAGMFQVKFMEVFGGPGKSGQIAIIVSLLGAALNFIGPVSSALTNRWGARVVTCAGAVTTACGFVISSRALYVWHLVCGFTIAGLGFGIAYIPAVVALCQYFPRRMALASAIATTGVGIGLFVLPPLITVLDHWFSWRGSLLILGAICLNMCVAGFTFLPIAKPHAESTNQKKKVLRVKMLKQPAFLCYIVNNILLLFGITAYYLHLPAYLDSTGYSHDESAMVMSVVGAATIVARLLYGFVVQRWNSPIPAYIVSMVLSGLAAIATPFLHDLSAVSIASVVFGCGAASLGLMMPLILAQLVGTQSIGDGYGYVMVAEGFGSLVGPPVAGLLYDISETYTLSLCTSGGIMIIGSLIMLYPMYRVKTFGAVHESLINDAQEMIAEQRVPSSQRQLLPQTSTDSLNFNEPVCTSTPLDFDRVEVVFK